MSPPPDQSDCDGYVEYVLAEHAKAKAPYDGVEPERVWLVRALTQISESLIDIEANGDENDAHLLGAKNALDDIIAQVADTKEPIT